MNKPTYEELDVEVALLKLTKLDLERLLNEAQTKQDKLEAEVARLREELRIQKPESFADTAYYWKMAARQQQQFKDEARRWARYWKRKYLWILSD